MITERVKEITYSISSSILYSQAYTFGKAAITGTTLPLSFRVKYSVLAIAFGVAGKACYNRS